MKTTLTVLVMMSLAATAGAQVVVLDQQAKVAAEQRLQVLLEKASAGGQNDRPDGLGHRRHPPDGEVATVCRGMLSGPGASGWAWGCSLTRCAA
jgi:hypothetical protein